jgi:putative transposase
MALRLCHSFHKLEIMPNYRRLRNPGGTYFFTVVTHRRIPILCRSDARTALRFALDRTRIRYPFQSIAWILLPDHLHCVWELPEGDSDFSTRWRLIKRRFTHILSDKAEHLKPPYWQKRFWEHCIRGQADLNQHIQYIHLNAVKHGFVATPEDWPYSTYKTFLTSGLAAGNPHPATLDNLHIPE